MAHTMTGLEGRSVSTEADACEMEQPTAAIVFCRTREEVDQVTEALNGRGYRAEAPPLPVRAGPGAVAVT